jgi:Flp pilus assembly protein TadG
MGLDGTSLGILPNTDRRRGAGLVEFCLVFLLFLSFVFGFFNQFLAIS